MPVFSLFPLSAQSFSAFGTVISRPSSNDTGSSANQGTATVFRDISPLSTSYPETRPGRPCMSLFSSQTRSLSVDGTISIPVLERHKFTSQTFVPLAMDSTRFRYIVVVAPPSSAPTEDKPDWNKLRAFEAQANQAVTYAAGTWHSPIIVLDQVSQSGGRDVVDFVVMQWINGRQDDDVTEVWPDQPASVQTRLSTSPGVKL